LNVPFVCLGVILLKLFVYKHSCSRYHNIPPMGKILEQFHPHLFSKTLMPINCLSVIPFPISCLSNGTHRRQISSLKLWIYSLYFQYTLSLYPQFPLPVGFFWYFLGDMFKSQSSPFSCSLKNCSPYRLWATHFSEDFLFKQF